MYELIKKNLSWKPSGKDSVREILDKYSNFSILQNPLRCSEIVKVVIIVRYSLDEEKYLFYK